MDNHISIVMKRFLPLALFLLGPVMALAQPTKIVKVLGDAISKEDMKPLAGKEWLLAIRAEDAIGEGFSGQVVELNVSAGAGKLRPDISSPLLPNSTGQTSLFGEEVAVFETDPSTSVLNAVGVKLRDNPDITARFEIATITGPVAVAASLVLDLVKENESKIQDLSADVLVESNAPWSSAISHLQVKQKGDKMKVIEISPKPGTFLLPQITGVPGDPDAIQKEIVGYNERNNLYLIRTKAKNQTSFFPFTHLTIDGNRNVVVKEEEFSAIGGAVQKAETEFLDYEFAQLPDGQRVWVFNKKVERTFEGIGKLLFTTTSTITNRRINSGIPDSEFQ